MMRSHDPEGFLSQDLNPMYFNRYMYTMNNPINAIDPDGEKITFLGDSTFYEKMQFIGALAAINSTPTGETSVKDLLTSDLNHSVVIGPTGTPSGAAITRPDLPDGTLLPDGTANVGSGTTIFWDPTNFQDNGGNPTVQLVHEVGHAIDENNGVHPRREDTDSGFKEDSDGNVIIPQTPRQETGSSMKIENEVRALFPEIKEREYFKVD